jgi:hypothetical protein
MGTSLFRLTLFYQSKTVWVVGAYTIPSGIPTENQEQKRILITEEVSFFEYRVSCIHNAPKNLQMEDTKLSVDK